MSIIVSGMRPTGRLHLGHLHGALRNWVRLQNERRCFFFVADWHALTTDPEHTSKIQTNGIEMVADWLAAGLDPKRAVIFRQSAIKEHAELHLLLSMITPTPWLLRNPTVKEQARDLGLLATDDEAEVAKLNYGLLGYPVLQAADVLIYKAAGVPVGVDQAPHIELTREIARRFNNYYGDVFPEPEALLTEVAKVPGTDGRKMSKSYNNAVFLSDPPEEIDAKLSRMMTDPRRVRRSDPGEPNDCPAFNLHRIYCTPDEIDYVTKGCRTAGIGCLDCKKVMIKHVISDLAPIRERRAALERRPQEVTAVLERGNEQARSVAAATMRDVRDAMAL
ncbi:MAG TPA: tryptophan--tRNA ligase [Candidatus Margulisiibacteriota bacterium]|nr:tryptophan--tRNA ligase [Candidatus Margulisiibacteriota bacterium]